MQVVIWYNINLSGLVCYRLENISNRVNQLFDFLYIRQGGMLETSILAALPLSLQRDVKRAHLPLLGTVPFFASLRQQNDVKYRRLLYLCAEMLMYRTYAPGQVVFHEGDQSCELILVKNGKLDMR